MPKRQSKPHAKRQNPAEAVIDIFGGQAALARALGLHRSTVCRWTMPVSKRGTGGRIPGAAKDRIMELACKRGLTEITYDVLYKGRVKSQ